MDGRSEQLNMFAARPAAPVVPSVPVAPAVVASIPAPAAMSSAKPAKRRQMARGAKGSAAKEVPAVEAEWTEWAVFTGPRAIDAPPGKKPEIVQARSAEHAAEIIGLQRGDRRARWAIPVLRKDS